MYELSDRDHSSLFNSEVQSQRINGIPCPRNGVRARSRNAHDIDVLVFYFVDECGVVDALQATFDALEAQREHTLNDDGNTRHHERNQRL